MSRYSREGSCEGCAARFRYFLVDHEREGSAYGYCDRCGTTVFLSGPREGTAQGHTLDPASEASLPACACGGRFRAAAGPRCPACGRALSPEAASAWLEANAPKLRRDWRWQRSWSGRYAIVIENRLVTDPADGGGSRTPADSR